MKTLVSFAVACAFILGAAARVFAGEIPKTKADCEKAHMKWDDSTKKCIK